MKKCAYLVLVFLMISSCIPIQEKTDTTPPRFRPAGSSAADVAINSKKEHQTIEGFGGTEHWLLPPPTEFSRIYDDLGVSILRFRMVNYIEAVPDEPGNEARDNDNNDPFTINWSNVKTRYFDFFVPLLQAAQSRGAKIYGDIMSPPQWMKTNNLENGQGSLKPGYEDELVEFILIWIQGLQIYHNVHIDYVNFANEPNYARDYDGCLITADQMRELTKKLGQRLAAEKLDTKIVPPETNTLVTFPGYANALCQDAKAKKNIHSLATHSYGPDFFSPDLNNDNWVAVKGIANDCGKPLWSTEYCLDWGNQKGTWTEAIHLVQHVHNALVYGNVTVWLYHELYADPSRSPLALIDPGNIVYPKFYTLKQYFRYIRPGAVRVETQSSDKNMLVSAFHHKQNATLSIVAINRKSSNEDVTFNISGIQGLEKLDVIRTSQNENAVAIGQVLVYESSFTYSLPANSITTFSGIYGTAR